MSVMAVTAMMINRRITPADPAAMPSIRCVVPPDFGGAVDNSRERERGHIHACMMCEMKQYLFAHSFLSVPCVVLYVLIAYSF